MDLKISKNYKFSDDDILGLVSSRGLESGIEMVIATQKMGGRDEGEYRRNGRAGEEGWNG